MGAECHVCGHDMIDECGWCELAAERDRYRDAIDAALPHIERAPSSRQSATAMRILTGARRKE